MKTENALGVFHFSAAIYPLKFLNPADIVRQLSKRINRGKKKIKKSKNYFASIDFYILGKPESAKRIPEF